jgi:hypothetical protein
MGTKVSVDNFVRAETARMFAGLQRDAGGVNAFTHKREPAPIDHQTVIRMNRDTLYSFAVVDVSEGATLRMPDSGGRYVSVMVVNEDHYINQLIHDAGEHRLTAEQLGSTHVCVVARTLVDPGDPDDVAAVAALQDQLVLEAASSEPFVMPDYDTQSFDATRDALLQLGRGMPSYAHSFGRREDVDPVRHLVATATGWGGLPDAEATYLGVEPNVPVGTYELTVRDVPVDGFWSISVYNRDGFFEPNDLGAYSVNNLTAAWNDDGSVTVRFGGCGAGVANCLPITDGWNYVVRLYRPRPEVLDGTWRFPGIDATA